LNPSNPPIPPCATDWQGTYKEERRMSRIALKWSQGRVTGSSYVINLFFNEARQVDDKTKFNVFTCTITNTVH
jgi:hypothetical protein